jgi:hypothetical protein
MALAAANQEAAALAAEMLVSELQTRSAVVEMSVV